MGIDAHSLHLLRHSARKHGPLGSTVTLGRMVVFLGPRERQRVTGADPSVATVYGEQLLVARFGATKVDSIDNSGYESATIVADMNKPINGVGPFDTVIDFGCTEHIFDVRQSMANISVLCRLGGRILHLLPANGYCGHGFYQFSPELFFSYYSPRNGYADTEVYLADFTDKRYWYKVTPPTGGQRVNVRSGRETVVLVSTRRVSETTELVVQQSDYEHEWAAPEGPPAPRSGKAVARAKIRERLMRLAPRLTHEIDSMFSPVAHKPLSSRHPSLERIATADL